MVVELAFQLIPALKEKKMMLVYVILTARLTTLELVQSAGRIAQPDLKTMELSVKREPPTVEELDGFHKTNAKKNSTLNAKKMVFYGTPSANRVITQKAAVSAPLIVLMV